MKRISIFDYGAGNLHSLAKALASAGEVTVERDVAALLRADLVVLPGVGAFGQAAGEIAPRRKELKDALLGGLPCIGICLGMQMLFDSSEESAGEGIGLIRGRVRRLDADRIPQMGWNTVDWITQSSADGASFDGERLDTAYFANAFVAAPVEESCALAWTTHESDRFPSVVRSSNTVGIQFHPEKSSRRGVEYLCAVAEDLIRCR